MKLTITQEAINVTVPTLVITERVVVGTHLYKIRIEYLGELLHRQFCRELELAYSGYPYSRKGEIVKNAERKLQEMKLKKLEVRDEKFVPGGKDEDDAGSYKI